MQRTIADASVEYNAVPMKLNHESRMLSADIMRPGMAGFEQQTPLKQFDFFSPRMHCYADRQDSIVDNVISLLEKAGGNLAAGTSEIYRVEPKRASKPVDCRCIWTNSEELQATLLENCHVVGDSPEDEHDTSMMYWVQLLADIDEKDFSTTFCCFHKDNGCPYEVRLVRIFDGYVLAGFRDITHEYETNKEIRYLEKQLAQSAKMEAMGNLAGGIAHDFNNILTAVLGWAELLKHDVSGNTIAKEKIERIVQAGNRAKDLVTQILSFSRKSSDRMVPTCIGTVVREALGLLRATIPTSIRITTDFDVDCGQVRGNPVMIHQIIMNLCTNAYHAMEDECGTIRVSLSAYDSYNGKKFVKMEVADTGQGISADDIPRIFDPFYTTKPSRQGTGMGLAVVSGIVRSCGGTIRVSSKQGAGTVFTVVLPQWIEEKHDQQTRTESLNWNNRARILLIDDEPDVLGVMTRMLERNGHLVTAMTNSKEALSAFLENKGLFDLVITDLSMPHITGDRLAGKILSIHPETPVVLCTGYSSRIDEKVAVKLGFRAFLYKPVDSTVLTSTVARTLSGNQGDFRGVPHLGKEASSEY